MLQQYQALLERGEIQLDPAQEAAAQRLDLLARELVACRPAPSKPANGGGFLARLGLAREEPPRRHPSASTSTAASGAASRC